MLFKQNSALVPINLWLQKAYWNTDEFGEIASRQEDRNDRKQESGATDFSARLAKTHDQIGGKRNK